ncbi:TetR/AcrR family transcriptional regulator [Sinomonas sp. JGH33]|uniref:TetR/AcrR family transcriptional regulator n=1 Tax=Sinomonas terricola TaxID=3110330 RepID=A0ABU5T6C6_9MICC|nr:TetR/AcrR family transcriptional regulator [Sinomonas sp. JGH33]MEA5455185.1 TetR/AcrR family transcriptional regulator [Sinomonas sp. JGH33]
MARTPSRQNMIDATARLLMERGYFGTGIHEVLEASGAPRGSMYYHFPGGKEQLAVEAVQQSGEHVRALLAQVFAETDDLGTAMERVVGFFAEQLRSSEYSHGCPVAPVVLVPDGLEELPGVVGGTFGGWHDVVAARLRETGVSEERAESVAWLALSALEGALLVSRARRDVTPLLRAGAEIAAQLRSLPRPDQETT